MGGEERETVDVDCYITSLVLKEERIRVVAARSLRVKSKQFVCMRVWCVCVCFERDLTCLCARGRVQLGKVE